MRAAAATVDITPDPGAILAGGAFGPAEGIAHPLAARALHLRAESGEGLLIVTADLLGLAADYAHALCRRLGAAAGGLSPEAVMLAATHTHGGPCTVDLRAWGRLDTAYLRRLEERLSALAARVAAGLRPARVRLATGACAGLSMNRTSYGGGLVDPTLAALLVETPAGEPIGATVNYACHPVTMHGTRLVSADFPHYVERAAQAALGGQPPVLFLNGACGDLNPADFRFDQDWRVTPEGRRTCEQTCRAMGERIGREAAALLARAAPDAEPALACATAPLTIPLQPLPPRAELEETARTAAAKMAAERDPGPRNWAWCGEATLKEWADAALAALDAGGARTATTGLEVQGFRIGRAALVGVPGELFTAYGQGIRRAGRGAPVLVATLANGCAGYFPAPKTYEGHKYEAVDVPRLLGLQAFAPDCGARVQAAGEAMVERLLAVNGGKQGART